METQPLYVLPLILRLLRESRRKDQSEVARALEITPSAVNQTEKGTQAMKESSFIAYAQVYDLAELDALEEGLHLVRRFQEGGLAAVRGEDLDQSAAPAGPPAQASTSASKPRRATRPHAPAKRAQKKAKPAPATKRPAVKPAPARTPARAKPAPATKRRAARAR